MTIFSILLGLIGLGIMVFVHELGHFVAAKANGVAVETFSLGWGPRLVGFKRGGTMYQISWFPIGGFCKMKGEITPGVAGGGAPETTETGPGSGGSFTAARPWRRIVISAAGPIFNLIFAAATFTIISLVGYSFASYDNRIALATDYPLQAFTQQPPATEAGLKTGDRILAIDGHPVHNFQDIREAVAVAPNERLTFSVQRIANGAEHTVDIQVVPRLDKNTGAGQIGILPWIDPVVASVARGSAASIAGLRAGDRVLSADGKAIRNIWDLMSILATAPGKMTMDFERGGVRQSTLVVYERGPVTGYDFSERTLGVAFAQKEYATPGLGLPGALAHGLSQTWDTFTLTVKGFGLLFQGVNLRKAVAGPLKIVDYIGTAAVMGGALALFQLLAFLSVVLFIMNLLPIPAMDGGQIILFVIEVIRGRAVPASLFWRVQIIGFSILLALIVIISFNDILSFVGR
jgi:regulator of sigma E protease